MSRPFTQGLITSALLLPCGLGLASISLGLAPLPTRQLLVVGHPGFTYSASSRGRTQSSACWGRSNSRSWTPALPEWHRRICSRTNATAKSGRRGSDETGSRRVVAAAQLVLGLASQTYEHSYSSGLIPQLVAPFMATFPRPRQSGYAAPREAVALTHLLLSPRPASG